MSVKSFLGVPYFHPQENEAFRHLCFAGEAYLANRGDVRIIGNVECNNCQMDALVLGRRSLTIVDFKDYGGTIYAYENREWRTSEGVQVKGGSHLNPYRQVHTYKSGLINWIKTHRLLPDSNDLRHISGLVIFTQAASINNEAMSPVSRKWFCAANFADGITFLSDRTSPSLELSPDCMDRIIESLRAQPFELKQSERLVPKSAVNEAVFGALRDLDDERMAKYWAENGDWLRERYKEAERGWFARDRKGR